MTIEKVREQIQEDIITYIEGKAFLHQDQFKDDICQIVVDRMNELKEMLKKDLTLGN
jgi:hypothetical protein